MANALNAEELEFVKAIEEFKKTKSKNFLSWTEVLSVLKSLGYRQSAQNRKKKAVKAAK